MPDPTHSTTTSRDLGTATGVSSHLHQGFPSCHPKQNQGHPQSLQQRLLHSTTSRSTVISIVIGSRFSAPIKDASSHRLTGPSRLRRTRSTKHSWSIATRIARAVSPTVRPVYIPRRSILMYLTTRPPSHPTVAAA